MKGYAVTEGYMGYVEDALKAGDTGTTTAWVGASHMGNAPAYFSISRARVRS